MSSTDIVPFAFQGVNIRTLLLDGKPWFVANDITNALGYKNGRDAIAKHTSDSQRRVSRIATPSGEQSATILSEGGVWRLVMRSNIPSSIAFQDWLADEVIPTLMRTGTYSVQADPTALDVGTIKQLHQAVAVLLEANERQAVEVAALAPRATAWDAIASAEGDYSVGEAAKILARAGVANIGPQRLFQRLADLGWTFRGPEGTWMAYAERIDRGHLAHKPQFHYHPRTQERVVDPPQLRVTLKGIELLRQRLGASGPVLRAVSA